MKKVLLLTLVALLGAGQAYAVGGSIGVFANGTANSCRIQDSIGGPGLVQVAIVHVLSDGATGCDYSAPPPACSFFTFLGELPNFGSPNPGVFQGSSTLGASVGYGSCKAMSPTNPVVAHISTINYFGSGIAAPCCAYPVIDHPGFPETTPVSVNCAPIQEREKEAASGGTGIINDSTCPCNVPNEPSTWGQIKELYAQ